MREAFTDYDPAESLTSDGAVAAFVADAFETHDADFIAKALGVVARAKGLHGIASQAGLSDEELTRSLDASGNTSLRATLAILKAVGLELTARAPA